MEIKPTNLQLSIKQYDDLLATILYSFININFFNKLTKPDEVKEDTKKLEDLFIQLDAQCPYHDENYQWQECIITYRKHFASRYPPKEDKKRFNVEL